MGRRKAPALQVTCLIADCLHLALQCGSQLLRRPSSRLRAEAARSPSLPRLSRLSRFSVSTDVTTRSNSARLSSSYSTTLLHHEIRASPLSCLKRLALLLADSLASQAQETLAG